MSISPLIHKITAMQNQGGTVFKLAVLAGLSALMAACASGDSYRSDEATQRTAAYAPNTPRPIPVPRHKPRPPAKAVAPGTVIVQRGDTVYGLGRRYGIAPQEIIASNRLAPPYTLEIGQRLTMPGGRKHTVRRGETVYGISRAYGVDMSELTRLNGIRAPYTLEIGDVLNLPPQTRVAVASSSGRSTAGPRNTPAKNPVPAPPPRATGGFIWPARGRVISTFGPKQQGRHNDGINIRVPRGTGVKAAQSGVVIYAGSGLKGFGNLVLIRHSGGWVSAYGHNDSLAVKRGEKVSRGQVIARAGSSGSVTEPQVHFELRKGTRAVDPKKHLPPV